MYNYPNNTAYYSDDDRFLLAPFLIGGLAGGALGYGIASNNNNSQQYYYPMYPMYPMYPNCCGNTTYPTYSTSNNYYY